MISLNQNDRLRLIDCPITVINGVRDSIKALSKLKDERNLLIAHEFKLKGYPWMAGGSESVDARLLVATILEKMASVGWPVLTSLDISRRANNKSVFFLRSTDRLSLSSTPSPSYFCISLNATDKVRLINAPNQVVGTLRNVVGTNWGPGIGKSQEYFGSYEMKLNGNPWNTVTKDGLAAKCLMCIILSTLEENGFSVTCSADVSAKYEPRLTEPDYPKNVHSWFVARSWNDFRQPHVFRGDTQDNNERAASISGRQPTLEYPNEPPPSYKELYGD